MRRWQVLLEPTVPILLLASVAHIFRHNVTDLSVFAGTALIIVLDSWRPRDAAPRWWRPRVAHVGTSRRARIGRVPGTGAPRRDGPGSAAAPAQVARAPFRRLPVPVRYGGRWVSACGVVAFGVVAAIAGRDSTAIRTVFVVVGIAAIWLVVVRPAESGGGAAPAEEHGSPDGGLRRAGSPRGWWVWAAIGLAACVWELTSFIFQQTDPTRFSAHPISDVTHPAASDLIGPLLAAWPGRAVFLALWAAAGLWLLRRLAGERADGPREPDTADGRESGPS